MNFSICSLALHEIEKLRTDSIAVFLFEDVVPLRGMAGMIDWRLNGMVSGLLLGGLLTAKPGENFLIPLKPRLMSWKLFGFGLGRAADFSIEGVQRAVGRAFEVLNRAAVHSTALMLPGRSEDLYGPDEGVAEMRGILRKGYDLDELVMVDRFVNPEKDIEDILGGLEGIDVRPGPRPGGGAAPGRS
jgi:hypothetical protein